MFPLNTAPNPPRPIKDSALKLFVAVASSRYVKICPSLSESSSGVSESNKALAGLATQRNKTKQNNERHVIGPSGQIFYL